MIRTAASTRGLAVEGMDVRTSGAAARSAHSGAVHGRTSGARRALHGVPISTAESFRSGASEPSHSNRFETPTAFPLRRGGGVKSVKRVKKSVKNLRSMSFAAQLCGLLFASLLPEVVRAESYSFFLEPVPQPHGMHIVHGFGVYSAKSAHAKRQATVEFAPRMEAADGLRASLSPGVQIGLMRAEVFDLFVDKSKFCCSKEDAAAKKCAKEVRHCYVEV